MSFKVDFSKLDNKLSEISSSLNKIARDALAETATIAANKIKIRTRKGLDKDGKNFKPYSESYRKQKAKAGASSKVNLTSVGRSKSGSKSLRGNQQGGTMLNSITTVEVKDRGTRYIVTAIRGIEEKKLKRHVRGDGVPVRNPIGFTNEEEAELKNRALRKINDKIKKIGLK